MTKPFKSRKIAVGIYLTTIIESMNLGYKDINEYIDALKQQITKLQKANEMAGQIIKELETKLKEKETAKEKEHS
jgi:predicted transcriptional regulator